MATLPSTTVSPAGSSADGVAWDLHDLYLAIDDPRIDGDLQNALAQAREFETAYRGRIAAATSVGAKLSKSVGRIAACSLRATTRSSLIR